MDKKDFLQEIAALWDKINAITKELSDFSEQLNNMRASDIDYIAMETGVDLDQDTEVQQ